MTHCRPERRDALINFPELLKNPSEFGLVELWLGRHYGQLFTQGDNLLMYRDKLYREDR